MAEAPLISVRTQVVLDVLVGSIAEAVALRGGQRLDASIESALAAAGDDRERRLARAGYLARGIEVERFERAREPMPWLAERTSRDGSASWSEAAGALAAELAETEPRERPEPQDERAVTWKVPGPGGHVRHYLALRAASDDDGDLAHLDAKRPWLVGFLVHCIEETSPPPGAAVSHSAAP